MTRVIVGDLVIDDNTVRFSDSVGHCASSSQNAILLQTAERLGKVAIVDRYPLSRISADYIETYFGRNEPRNEHGVPNRYILDSIIGQHEDLMRNAH